MSNSNFTTTLLVDQSVEEVFRAINNVRGWWQGEIDGNSDKLDDEFIYRMDPYHVSKQKVIELISNKKILWLVTESELSFTKKKDEWTGTKICFELSSVENLSGATQTKIHFTHDGLVPTFECYGDCTNGWTQLIHKSLVGLITEGKGVKVF